MTENTVYRMFINRIYVDLYIFLFIYLFIFFFAKMHIYLACISDPMRVIVFPNVRILTEIHQALIVQNFHQTVLSML